MEKSVLDGLSAAPVSLPRSRTSAVLGGAIAARSNLEGGCRENDPEPHFGDADPVVRPPPRSSHRWRPRGSRRRRRRVRSPRRPWGRGNRKSRRNSSSKASTKAPISARGGRQARRDRGPPKRNGRPPVRTSGLPLGLRFVEALPEPAHQFGSDGIRAAVVERRHHGAPPGHLAVRGQSRASTETGEAPG